MPQINSNTANGLRIRTRLAETVGNAVRYEFEFENVSGTPIPVGGVRFYIYLNTHKDNFTIDSYGSGGSIPGNVAFAKLAEIDYIHGQDTVNGGNSYQYDPLITVNESPFYHKKFSQCIVFENNQIIPANYIWTEQHRIRFTDWRNFGPERQIPNYSVYGYAQNEAHSNEKNNSGQVARALEYRHSYSYVLMTTSFERLTENHGIVFEINDGGTWKYWKDDYATEYNSPNHPLHTVDNDVDYRDSDSLVRIPTYRNIGILQIETGTGIDDADSYIDLPNPNYGGNAPDDDHRGESTLKLSASTSQYPKSVIMKFDESVLDLVTDEIEYAELWLYATSYNTQSSDWDSGEAIEVRPLLPNTDEWWKVGEDAKYSNLQGQTEETFPLTFETGFKNWTTGLGWVRFQSFFNRNEGIQKWLNEIRTAIRASRGIILDFPSIQTQNIDQPSFSSNQITNQEPFIVFGYGIQTPSGSGEPTLTPSILFSIIDITPSDGEDGEEVRIKIRAWEKNNLFSIIVSQDSSNMVTIDQVSSVEGAFIDYSTVEYYNSDTIFDVVVRKDGNLGIKTGTINLDGSWLDIPNNTQYTGAFETSTVTVGASDPVVPPTIPPKPTDPNDPTSPNYRFWQSLKECERLPVIDSCRKINLTNFVTDYLHETEFVDFVKTFEDELNEVFEGKCFANPQATHISILEKIDQLIDLQDPERIELDHIHHLASNLGYNMTVNILQSKDISELSGDLKKYVRFFVASLIEINRMKTTKDCIRGLMHSVGVLTNIYYHWTNEYDSEYDLNWRESNENDIYDESGVENVHVTENDFFLTPHFRLDLDISNVDLTTSELMVGILTRVAQSVDAVKPVNTVSQDLSLSIPITEQYTLKNVIVRGWGDGINSEGEYDENWESPYDVSTPTAPIWKVFYTDSLINQSRLSDIVIVVDGYDDGATYSLDDGVDIKENYTVPPSSVVYDGKTFTISSDFDTGVPLSDIVGGLGNGPATLGVKAKLGLPSTGNVFVLIDTGSFVVFLDEAGDIKLTAGGSTNTVSTWTPISGSGTKTTSEILDISGGLNVFGVHLRDSGYNIFLNGYSSNLSGAYSSLPVSGNWLIKTNDSVELSNVVYWNSNVSNSVLIAYANAYTRDVETIIEFPFGSPLHREGDFVKVDAGKGERIDIGLKLHEFSGPNFVGPATIGFKFKIDEFDDKFLFNFGAENAWNWLMTIQSNGRMHTKIGSSANGWDYTVGNTSSVINMGNGLLNTVVLVVDGDNGIAYWKLNGVVMNSNINIESNANAGALVSEESQLVTSGKKAVEIALFNVWDYVLTTQQIADFENYVPNLVGSPPVITYAPQPQKPFVLSHVTPSSALDMTLDGSNGKKNVQLTAYDTNGNDVTLDIGWSSDNGLIIPVTNGYVQSFGVGTAIIKAIYFGTEIEIPVQVYATDTDIP